MPRGQSEAIELPRAWLEEGSYDFSFSGLKSAVLNYLNRCEMKGIEINKPDIAASFRGCYRYFSAKDRFSSGKT